MMRQPFERCSFHVEGTMVVFAAQKWQQVQHGHESFDDYEAAVERYEEMKMIAATDYGFTLFMENIDEE